MDNPPAFPLASDIIGHHEGMTLRDWFAGRMVTGYLSSYQGSVHPDEAATIAKLAYQMADAMLAERAKEPDNAHD